MPLRKFRYVPDDHDDARASPRLAADHDLSVASPVHGMQRNLWNFAEIPTAAPTDLYPGRVRLMVPVVISAGLWVVIFWSLGHLR